MTEDLVLDTNILIYNLDQDSKYFDISNEILGHDFHFYVTTKTTFEFTAVLSKIDFDFDLIAKQGSGYSGSI